MAEEATATTEGHRHGGGNTVRIMGSSSNIEARGLEWEALPSRFRNGRISSSRNATRILLNCALRLVYGTSSRFGGRGILLLCTTFVSGVYGTRSRSMSCRLRTSWSRFYVKQSLQRSRRSLKGLLCRLWVIGDGEPGLSCAIGLPHWRPIVVCGHRSGRWVAGCALGDVGGPGRWFYSAVCGAFFTRQSSARCRGR